MRRRDWAAEFENGKAAWRSLIGRAAELNIPDAGVQNGWLACLADCFVAGVQEGRGVFANIRKFTTYVLASNVPEIVPYLLYIVLPVPLALTVVQILAIDPAPTCCQPSPSARNPRILN